VSTEGFETSLRRYLAWLDDERSLVDTEEVTRLEGLLEHEHDAIGRLRLLSELDRVRQGLDVAELEATVADGLAEWAAANAVTVGALAQVGVPDALLERAGLPVPATRPAPARPARRTRRPAAHRAEPLALDEVRAAITSRLGPTWKLADLAAAVGREPATARNHLQKLIAAGDVIELGDDPAHDGRGRAPKLYAGA